MRAEYNPKPAACVFSKIALVVEELSLQQLSSREQSSQFGLRLVLIELKLKMEVCLLYLHPSTSPAVTRERSWLQGISRFVAFLPAITISDPSSGFRELPILWKWTKYHQPILTRSMGS
jgi:hypothetical protein